MTTPGEHYDIDPGMARERTSLAWTRTAISFAAVAGVVLKRELIPGLILLSLTPAVWQLGRLAYRRPVKFRVVTATIVAVSAVALVISFTAGSGKGSATALRRHETQLVGQHHRLHPVAQAGQPCVLNPPRAQYGYSPARRLSADGRLANSGVSLLAKTVLWGRMKQGPPHV